MDTIINSNKIVLKWTIIYVITSIVITYVFQFTNIDSTSSLRYLSFIPFFAFMLLAQTEFKDQLGGYITFGQAFLTGFKYAIFSGLILTVFTYFYLTYTPGVFEKIISDQQQSLTDKGTLSSDQIDTTIDITRKYGILFATIGSVIGSALTGSIFGLIGAAIFKKEKPLFITESDEPTV